MKYNEAIDMILDGGEAFYAGDPSICYFFHKRGPNIIFSQIERNILLKTKDYSYGMEAVLTAKKIKGNWIVEKDGVVYQEYPYKPSEIIENRIVCMMRKGSLTEDVYSMLKKIESGCYETCALCHTNRKIFIKDRGNEQKPPADFEKPRQSFIDEEWLDKKMLCFVRRYKIPGNPGVPANKYAAQEDFSKCYNAECPFCFPEDKNKRQYPDFIDCERCGMGMYKTNELKLSCPPQPIYRCPNCDDKEDRIGEDKSEKVTISEIDALLTGFAQDYHIAKTMGADGSLMQYIMENSKAEKLLRQKLEYLISLQDKNEL